jgi:predicted SPOUT superfamily RNA methylase MTH1
LALLGRRLAISIPDTVLEEKASPREKTAKLGLVARACAIYGVDVVEVFRDPGGRGEGATIRRVLEYLETPQYLRKRLFPLDEMLKYAGILPPLRIPSHRAKVSLAALPPGQVREGVVNVDGTVDIGLEVPFRIKEKAPSGRRVTVRVTSVSPPVAELVSRESVGEYWGYVVEAKSVSEVLSDQRFEVKIATSRLGKPLSESLGPLREAMAGRAGVKLLFGSPSRGLFDIVGKDLGSRVELVVNLFPEQKVETVRTEEAILAGLGLVGLLSAGKA